MIIILISIFKTTPWIFGALTTSKSSLLIRHKYILRQDETGVLLAKQVVVSQEGRMCDPLERPSTYMAADQQPTKMPGSTPLPYLRKGDCSHVWSLIPQKKEPDKTTENWAMSEASAALWERGWREVSFFFSPCFLGISQKVNWHGRISLHTASLCGQTAGQKFFQVETFSLQSCLHTVFT